MHSGRGGIQGPAELYRISSSHGGEGGTIAGGLLPVYPPTLLGWKRTLTWKGWATELARWNWGKGGGDSVAPQTLLGCAVLAHPTPCPTCLASGRVGFAPSGWECQAEPWHLLPQAEGLCVTPAFSKHGP